MGQNGSHSCLPHKEHVFRDLAVFSSILDFGQTAGVQWRMWQDSVHEGQSEQGKQNIDDADQKNVPIVRIAFLEFVLGWLDHGGRHILIHEEQEWQRKSKTKADQHADSGKLIDSCPLKGKVFAEYKLFHFDRLQNGWRIKILSQFNWNQGKILPKMQTWPRRWRRERRLAVNSLRSVLVWHCSRVESDWNPEAEWTTRMYRTWATKTATRCLACRSATPKRKRWFHLRERRLATVECNCWKSSCPGNLDAKKIKVNLISKPKVIA